MASGNEVAQGIRSAFALWDNMVGSGCATSSVGTDVVVSSEHGRREPLPRTAVASGLGLAPLAVVETQALGAASPLQLPRREAATASVAETDNQGSGTFFGGGELGSCFGVNFCGGTGFGAMPTSLPRGLLPPCRLSFARYRSASRAAAYGRDARPTARHRCAVQRACGQGLGL
jgi:hypothetical protein